MAMLRNDFTRLLTNRATEIFWENYKEVAPVWRNFFSEVNIETPYVEKQSMLGMGDLVEKPENTAFAYDTPSMGWPILGSVRSYGKAVAFSAELYSDTQFMGLFTDLVAQISQNYPRTRDRFYAQFFNKGALEAGDRVFDATVPGVKTDATGGFIYDGKPLFADADNGHPALMNQGQTYANYAALELTQENLEAVYKKMTIDNAYDEQGNKIILRPDTLVVPQELELKAIGILNAEYTATSAGVASTIRNPMYRRFQLVVWPHLTDADGWFLIQRGYGFKALLRQDPIIDVWVDNETKQYRGSVFCRFGGYVDNWRYAFACNTPQA